MKGKNIKKTKKKNNLLSSTWIFLLIISVCLTSIAYSALGTNLLLSGEAHLRVPADVRITNISWDTSTNNGYETYSSEYYKDGIKMFTTLPELGSTVTYEVEVTNASDNAYMLSEINNILNSNQNIKYSISGLNIGDLIYGNSVVTFTIVVSYDETVTELPSNNLSNFEISFKFEIPYTLTIDLNGGQSSQTTTYYMVEGAQITLTSPTKENYTFVDWAVSGVNSNVTGTTFTMGSSDATVTARYYKNLFANGETVYFNVKTGEVCTETDYHVDNSLTGYNGTESTKTTDNQTSCLKFYAYLYDEGDARVNLLLDHNTTAQVYWNSSRSNGAGPSTSETELLGKLKTDTTSWVGTKTPANYTVIQEGYGNYTIDYSDYKARLITADEIAQITGNTSFDESTTSDSNWFYFDSLTTSAASDCTSGDTSGCEYGWLYDRTYTSCTTNGCYNNADSGMTGYGYWTSTSAFGRTTGAWCVNYYGTLINWIVNYSFRGVRPVIEVLKSKFDDDIGGDTSCEEFTFTYTGDYELIDDGDGNYRIKFLESGTFTPSADITIDAFLVGGGGGGGISGEYYSAYYGGGGGGGGYTKTKADISITAGTPYTITIGAGGGSEEDGDATTAFNTTANGGKAGDTMIGGAGGSGGGAGGWSNDFNAGAGGSDGSDGSIGDWEGFGSVDAASGQGTTTCEFGEKNGTSCKYTDNGNSGLYSGGGGGGAGWTSSGESSSAGSGGSGGGANGATTSNGKSAADNTGGGGGGGVYTTSGGSGGSGIVVIRYNKNDACEDSGGDTSCETVPFEFTFNGDYELINDGNNTYRLRLLESGTFSVNTDLDVDIFLVGGGGGGGNASDSGSKRPGGGGGGYTNTVTGVALTSGTSYSVTVGTGGAGGSNGGQSKFSNSYTANGGKAGGTPLGENTGGDGGSGGGGGTNSTNTYGTGGYNGSDGADGYGGSTYGNQGGQGQGTTTCEFGEYTSSSCVYTDNGYYGLYGGGGGGAIYVDSSTSPYPSGAEGGYGGGGNGGTRLFSSVTAGATNTGGGGGGGGYYEKTGGKGGSGIVILRYTIPEQQECEDSGSSGGTTTSSFDFTYTGRYTIIDDGDDNWRVKFLSSGTFTPTVDSTIDVFLVGGGEGGGCGSIPGGGGGYTTTQTGVSVTAGTPYTITIGEGGTAATTATLSTWSSSDGGNGGTSSAFGYTAAGGGSEKQGWGGSGGGGMHNNGVGGTGGAYGLPGENVDEDNQYSAAGDGQHLTTCEFGRGTVYGCYSGVTAYGGGGGGGAISTGSPGKGGDGGGGSYGGNGETNTGGGGGSTYYNGSTFVKPGDGGSGIVIIRNTR